MKTQDHITHANANVFEELGLPDAANLRIRAELMHQITSYYKSTGQKQADVAKALGTTQPRLSDVINGRIDKCSIDRLVAMLDAVGRVVKVKVSKAA